MKLLLQLRELERQVRPANIIITNDHFSDAALNLKISRTTYRTNK